MSTRKQDKAIQNFQQIGQLSKTNRKDQMQWLMRSLLVIGRQPRLSGAGFVLPTVAMVSLVVVLLTTAILIRSFEQSRNASNVRVNQVDEVVHMGSSSCYYLTSARALNNLDSHVRLDVETTLESLNGVQQIQFDYRGNVSKPLFGRITLSSQDGGKLKRCVYVYTILGAMRTAKENSKAKSGSYCY